MLRNIRNISARSFYITRVYFGIRVKENLRLTLHSYSCAYIYIARGKFSFENWFFPPKFSEILENFTNTGEHNKIRLDLGNLSKM